MSRASKTTEFSVFLAAVVAVVITAVMVGQDENTGIDPFGALEALQYITFLRRRRFNRGSPWRRGVVVGTG